VPVGRGGVFLGFFMPPIMQLSYAAKKPNLFSVIILLH
jgi:hypothetical protein